MNDWFRWEKMTSSIQHPQSSPRAFWLKSCLYLVPALLNLLAIAALLSANHSNSSNSLHSQTAPIAAAKDITPNPAQIRPGTVPEPSLVYHDVGQVHRTIAPILALGSCGGLLILSYRWGKKLQTQAQELAEMAAQLQQTQTQLDQQTQKLEQSLKQLQQTPKLIQAEKMISLGRLVAGVAHEINNPVSFIAGNLSHARRSLQDLLQLIESYQQQYPEPTADLKKLIKAIELDYLIEDLPKMMTSMGQGASRIQAIVLSLRNFARLDESDMKLADLQEGIENTLLLLQHRLSSADKAFEIQVVKSFQTLPEVECYPGQLNQVFMNLLTNAIDALEEKYITTEIDAEINAEINADINARTDAETDVRIGAEMGTELDPGGEAAIATPTTQEKHPESPEHLPLSRSEAPSNGLTQSRVPYSAIPTITIRTEVLRSQWIRICIADNGVGMSAEVRSRLYDPFFTTKPVGSGTGLGLTISYQIITEKHGGKLSCNSAPGQGAEFTLEIPIERL